MFLRSLSAFGRRTFLVLGVSAFVTAAAGVTAQQQPPQTPPPAGQPPAGQQPAPAQPAPAQPAGPMLPMSSDAGLILFTVKADGAADFEAFMTKVKEALEKSPKPEYKQMAAGWKLYKGLEGAEAGQVLYVAVVDPAVKGVDYDPLKIVREVMPTEEAAMRPKILAAVSGVNKLNLQNTLKMGGGN
jgi:hypothetical protein